MYPDPDSRLADPTDPDFPLLPAARAAFCIPARPRPASKPKEPLPAPGDESLPEPQQIDDLDHVDRLASAAAPDHACGIRLRRRDRSRAFKRPSEEAGLSPPLPDDAEPADQRGRPSCRFSRYPSDSWTVLPQSCLQHMLEFDSVRAGVPEDVSLGRRRSVPRHAKRRLGLSQIVDLAVRNSREYQTEEERLYVAAFDVSLQRYDYQLKFSPSGNGIDTNYNYGTRQ